eukprot:CCRYP_001016-RA/>CCRYP_001016-RA protein AED:0.33 eAED:0.24 QI:0/0/0/1/1/1/3/0/665
MHGSPKRERGYTYTKPTTKANNTAHPAVKFVEELKADGNGNVSLADKLKAAAVAEKLKQRDSKDSSQSNVNNDSTMTRHPPKATTNLIATVAAAKFRGATAPWGSYTFLESLDISSLSNEKLKRHLKARGELTEGSKIELTDRLMSSLEEEMKRELAIKQEIEAKHKQVALLEEQGAVYAVGKNNMGQLGLGDFKDRHTFTVVPITRGRYCQHVSTSTGANMSFATTEKHEIFAWGGGGMGPMGLKGSKQNVRFETPQLVVALNGEEIIMTSIGANHAIAISKGGDLFSWGKGDFGVLGARSTMKVETPTFLGFDKPASVVSCGDHHTCIKTTGNEVYVFGHSANGRLGIGSCETETRFQPFPVQVRLPASQVVRLVACGSDHTLVSTKSTTFSWGSGDGGKLGHGDLLSRWEPTEITGLRGCNILDISAGTWHSACVVRIPPMKDSGYLYTFGSGYQRSAWARGGFWNGQITVRRVFCGSSHNAVIASDGNVWTWGSNRHGALGRSIGKNTNSMFTPNPGIVIEFGTIVNRIGRGLPKSVACGREYTIVATTAYDGPSEEEALEILAMQRVKEAEERKRQADISRTKEEEMRLQREQELERQKIRYLTSKRLCTMDPKCPGFTYEVNRPSCCRECGFSVAYHTIVVDEPSTESAEGRQNIKTVE